MNVKDLDVNWTAFKCAAASKYAWNELNRQVRSQQ